MTAAELNSVVENDKQFNSTELKQIADALFFLHKMGVIQKLSVGFVISNRCIDSAVMKKDVERMMTQDAVRTIAMQLENNLRFITSVDEKRDETCYESSLCFAYARR